MLKSSQLSVDAETLARLCVEYWKLATATEKAASRMSSGDARRLEGQLKFSRRQLELLVDELELKLIDFHGEPFHAGLAVSVDNPGEYDDETALVVGKTLEPTIMAGMRVVRRGRVVVEPAE